MTDNVDGILFSYVSCSFDFDDDDYFGTTAKGRKRGTISPDDAKKRQSDSGNLNRYSAMLDVEFIIVVVEILLIIMTIWPY